MATITSRQELIDGLKNAIIIEAKARDSYIEDVKHFKDPYIKSIIQKVKEDEDKHIKILEGLISMLEKK